MAPRFLGAISAPIRAALAAHTAPLHRLAERQLLLQAQAIAHTTRGKERLEGLHAAEFCAFSQWGEDGIIDWLIEHLPGIPRSFVEFGVQDYRESNTRLLLQLRNWRGLVLDGSAAHIADIKAQDISWRHDLTAKCAFIDRDNINDLIAGARFGGDIGLLSIDIDGNDYWVWEGLTAARPWIVICEYNAVLGDRRPLSVPYDSSFERTKAHHSNLYFGASIRALTYLAERKGYRFVGTVSSGCNAFFVRGDIASPVAAALYGTWMFPSSVREARDVEGRLILASGLQRKKLIDRLPLIDVESGSTTALASVDAYSPEWTASMPTKFT